MGTGATTLLTEEMITENNETKEAPEAPAPEAPEAPAPEAPEADESKVDPPEDPEERRAQALVQQAVDNLVKNSLLHLAPSPLHGIGVFSDHNIRKDTTTWSPAPPCLQIGEEKFKTLPVNTGTTIRSLFARSDMIPRFGTHLLGVHSFLNHSNRPTAEFRSTDQTIRTLRDLRAGEEITIDYRTSGPGWLSMLPTDKAQRRGRAKKKKKGHRHR